METTFVDTNILLRYLTKAYNAIFMSYHGLLEIYSYDEDFELMEDIQRREP